MIASENVCIFCLKSIVCIVVGTYFVFDIQHITFTGAHSWVYTTFPCYHVGSIYVLFVQARKQFSLPIEIEFSTN